VRLSKLGNGTENNPVLKTEFKKIKLKAYNLFEYNLVISTNQELYQELR
jgi:hypothetical protein